MEVTVTVDINRHIDYFPCGSLFIFLSLVIFLKCFRVLMKRKRTENRLEYELDRRHGEKTKRDEQARVWQNIGEDLTRDNAGTKKLLYFMSKNYGIGANELADAIKNQDEQLLTQPKHIINI